MRGSSTAGYSRRKAQNAEKRGEVPSVKFSLAKVRVPESPKKERKGGSGSEESNTSSPANGLLTEREVVLITDNDEVDEGDDGNDDGAEEGGREDEKDSIPCG